MDEMVKETQVWLNKTYGKVAGFGKVPENGNTGWDTVYGLTRALQHELGITNLVNNFGPSTAAKWDAQFAGKVKTGFKHNVVKIIQGGFWCKGINPEDFTGEFTTATAAAVVELKKDAGIKDTSAKVNSDIMQALLTMSAFVLVPGGDAKIRSMQQQLNHDYQAYTGILPCDGIYQRDTNTALIYALQAVEGMDTETANGYYGPGTINKTPTVSSGATGAIVKIIQYGLYVNGFYSGAFNGQFTQSVADSVVSFRKFMKLPPYNSTADLTVIKGLLTSNGNTNRSSDAVDMATQITSASTAKALKTAGYNTVGRYLTGSVGTGSNKKDKNLTSREIKFLTDVGISIFPIYEDGGYEEKYFTSQQGFTDASIAVNTARNLGLPTGTTIYFAVDVDIQDGNMRSTVVPYFEGIDGIIKSTEYNVGIYGTRNSCLHVTDLVKYSFVADMSSGWSGNLGFKMPKNWSFDQFNEFTGASTGIDMDQVAISGKDYGFSKVNKINKNPNSAFFNQLQKVEEEANNYIHSTNIKTSVAQLIAQFYRQYSYSSASWIPVAGGLNSGWLAMINSSLNISSEKDFKALHDNSTGIEIGLPHMMASLNSLLFWGEPQSASGIQDLGGWCGDLLTSIEDAHVNQKNYNSFYEAAVAYVGKKGQFGREDLLDDLDALNVYSTIKTQTNLTVSKIIENYYTGNESSVRFNSYLGNRFDDNLTTLENDTYILLTGGKGSWGVAYKKALDAFKKFKMSKYSSYTDSEAKDTAKAFHLLIEQNA